MTISRSGDASRGISNTAGSPHARRWIALDGRRVAVLTSYPQLGSGMDLHSLADPSEFVCTVCGEHQNTALVATCAHSDAPVCAACYALCLSRFQTPSAEAPTPDGMVDGDPC
ncbi:MAG: hypothetical protein ACRDRN_10095 [Sciscionella sp.]